MARHLGALALTVFIAAVVLTTAACRPHRSSPNDAYLDPNASAEEWNRLLTSPGRELYEQRELILRLAAIKPGMTVADGGAGTGLFSMMLSDAVGPTGRVYAEDILGTFSVYVAEAAARQHRANVVSVVGTEWGIGLPPGSVDLAFLCDVYHHFDHPQEMLSSIRTALHRGGEVVLVEFRREPAAPSRPLPGAARRRYLWPEI